MPDVELPDGTVARFPDEMPDTEIEAVLRKQFALRRPQRSELLPGEREVRDNASEVTYDDHLGLYSVIDWTGRARGYRSSLSEAIVFADSLPGEPPPRPRRPAPTLALPVIPRESLAPVQHRLPRVYLNQQRRRR